MLCVTGVRVTGSYRPTQPECGRDLTGCRECKFYSMVCVCGQVSCIVGAVHCEEWAEENRAGFVTARFLGGRGDSTWSNFLSINV